MKIDKETIKALSADTRVDILKALSERRKTPTELSKQLDLASSTIVEHLRKLEDAGLIQRMETHHKWIYYEITSKGRSLVNPRIPIYVLLSLPIGIGLMFFGMSNIFAPVGYAAEKLASQQVAAGAASVGSLPVEEFAISWPFAAILIVGLAVLLFGLWKIAKRR